MDNTERAVIIVEVREEFLIRRREKFSELEPEEGRETMSLRTTPHTADLLITAVETAHENPSFTRRVRVEPTFDPPDFPTRLREDALLICALIFYLLKTRPVRRTELGVYRR